MPALTPPAPVRDPLGLVSVRLARTSDRIPYRHSTPTAVGCQAAPAACESTPASWGPTVGVMESTPQRVREVRIALGMKQEEFARKVDVGLKAVQHWESGRRTPERDSLAKIANGLGKLGNDAFLYITGMIDMPAWVARALPPPAEVSSEEVRASATRRIVQPGQADPERPAQGPKQPGSRRGSGQPKSS